MVKYIYGLSVVTILLSIMTSCAAAPRASESLGDGRMITFSVSLELSVRNAEETRDILIEQIRHNNGLILRMTGNFITAQIPSKNLEAFVSNVRSLGNIEDERRTGIDITDQYRDNISRLKSLKLFVIGIWHYLNGQILLVRY